MHPIDTLIHEHAEITEALAALRVYGVRVGSRGDANPDDLPVFVAFFRDFADLHHQRKEEQFLFAAMEADGFPHDDGPIAIVLAEHDEGRALVNHLGALCGRRWSDGHRTQVRVTIASFAGLLAEHISKENEVIYEIARNTLTPEVFIDMEINFTLIDAEFPDASRKALRPLIRRYLT